MNLHKRKRFAGHDPVKAISLFDTVCGLKVTGSAITEEQENITCTMCLNQDKIELSKEVRRAKNKHDRLVERLISLRVKIKEMERVKNG